MIKVRPVARGGLNERPPKLVPRTHQQLESLDAQVDALYELMPFGSYCTDSDGKILSINAAALALLGRDRKELIGKVIPDACFTATSLEQLAQILASGDDDFDDCKLNVYGADGTIHHVLFSGRLVGEATGATRSRRFVIMDITESWQTTVRRSSRAVEVLCKHIDMNAPPHLSTDQMAAITGLTSRALSYAFRRQFGCTPIEWQRNHFLDLAHRYLTEENVTASIKSVSRRFGFASTASFSQFYRRRFGTNPGEADHVRTP